MLPVKGMQKTSLIDYPGKICSILFLAGCNFRCGFCQNPDLITDTGSLPSMPESEIFDFLSSRKKWIDGVCITGGEPCLYKDLPDFVRKIKETGLLVKLDTNGTAPGMLEYLVKNKLVDYIAMDIKASPERYEKVAGAEMEIKDIEKSIELIKNSGIEYEFRTTVVPGLFDKEEALKIGKWLKGSKRYFIQQFRPDTVLDGKFKAVKPFSEAELKEFAGLLRPFFEKVEVRN
jgi:pyruvate formate lyase activating enzyme